MKTTMKICIILIATFWGTAFTSKAQEKQPLDVKQMLLEIKKEKSRAPIKIADAMRNQQLEERGASSKTRASDTKLTNNASSGIDEAESFIAMDPSNNNNLVMSYMANSNTTGITYPIYYSSNAGQSWIKSSFNSFTYLQQSFPGGSFLGGGDPIFAYDKSGKLYFSWIYLVAKANVFDSVYACMFLASSSNNGQTWNVEPGNDRFIAYTALNPNTFEGYANYEGFYDRQWFAMDLTNGANANTLYCSFVYFPNEVENQNVTGQYIKKKSASAVKFTNTKNQINSGISQFGNVAVTPDGKLHTTYADLGMGRVMHAVSSDGGSTFSGGHTISTGTNLFGSQGNGFVHDRENSAINLIAGGSVLHVVWSDFPASAGANYNSYYSRSTDGGTTWSPRLNLSTIFNTTDKGFMPTVCAHNDRVSIGAYIINPSNVSEFQMVTSYNDGVNWNSPILLSSQPTDFASFSNSGVWFGDYSNAVRNQDKSYFIWSDGRGTNGSKMYVSVVSEWATSVTEVTAINGSFSLESYFPNPTTDVLNLQLSSDKSNDLTVTLQTIEGKILSTQALKMTQGNQQISIPTNVLTRGNYVLKITNGDGEFLSRLISK